jgi:hypothetical protein
VGFKRLTASPEELGGSCENSWNGPEWANIGMDIPSSGQETKSTRSFNYVTQLAGRATACKFMKCLRYYALCARFYSVLN